MTELFVPAEAPPPILPLHEWKRNVRDHLKPTWCFCALHRRVTSCHSPVSRRSLMLSWDRFFPPSPFVITFDLVLYVNSAHRQAISQTNSSSRWVYRKVICLAWIRRCNLGWRCAFFFSSSQLGICPEMSNVGVEDIGWTFLSTLYLLSHYLTTCVFPMNPQRTINRPCSFFQFYVALLRIHHLIGLIFRPTTLCFTFTAPSGRTHTHSRQSIPSSPVCLTSVSSSTVSPKHAYCLA